MRPTILILSLTLILRSGYAQDVSDLFERLNPAVVTIQTFKKERPAGFSGQQGSKSTSSGVIIDPLGLILTTAHSVNDVAGIQVKLYNDTIYGAEVLKTSRAADVALLKLQERDGNLPVARLGDSDSVRVGNPVMLIGAPYGYEHSLSYGHISRKMAQIHLIDGETIGFFQTDASINTGNSGGPMFNMDGEVIGIVSYLVTEGGGYDGIGFCVDINSARNVLFNDRSALWEGLKGTIINSAIARQLDLPQSYGILLETVDEGSVAHRMGLRGGGQPREMLNHPIITGGDIVLKIAGITCDHPADLEFIKNRINQMEQGDKLEMLVWRNGETFRVQHIFQE